MPDAGRFPRPWTVARNADAWWVQSANGAKFGFTYYRSAGVISDSYHSEDDARRLVTNFAKLGQS